MKIYKNLIEKIQIVIRNKIKTEVKSIDDLFYRVIKR